jgi:hypothetical protein
MGLLLGLLVLAVLGWVQLQQVLQVLAQGQGQGQGQEWEQGEVILWVILGKVWASWLE